MPLRKLFLVLSSILAACGTTPAPEPDASTPERDGGAPIEDAATPPIDAGPPPALCDDGNPCTRDRASETGCLFEARADGTVCEDGDLCTLADRCASGACVSGERSTAPAELLGRARTFGTADGATLLLDGGRALFIDSPDNGTSFTLARLGEGIEPLDTVLADMPSLIQERAAPTASLGGDLVALVDPFERELHLISTEGDRVAMRTRLPLSDTAQPVAIAGDRERLFLCGVDFFRGGIATVIDISDPDAPLELGTIDFGGERCGTVALSEDGDRLYVATESGLRLFDARTFPPVPAGIVGPSARVSVHRDRLVLHTREGVQIFRESDLSSITSIPLAATGVSLSEHGLVIEGARDWSGGSEVFVALYSIDDGSLVDEVVVQRSPFFFEGEIQRIAANDRYLVHSYSKRTFEMGSDGFRELSPSAPGNIDYIQARGDRVVARSRHSSMMLDASDPSAPRVIAGGVQARSPQLLLELPEDGELRVWDDVNASSVSDVHTIEIYPFRNEVVLDRVRFDDADARTDLGTVELPRGHAYLMARGDALYRLTIGTNGARLERYGRADLETEATPSPELAIDLVPEEPIELANDPPIAFAVDPIARRAAIALGRVGEAREHEARILIADLESGAVRSFSVDSIVPAIAIAGDRIAYTDWLELAFVDISGGEVVEVSRATIGEGDFIDSILAFDGRHVYAAHLDSVSVVPFGATTEAFRYSLPGHMSAFASIDGGVVVAGAIDFNALAPYCPPGE